MKSCFTALLQFIIFGLGYSVRKWRFCWGASEQQGSLRSKRSRTARTKFGPREGVFRAARMRKNAFERPEFRSRGMGTLATQASSKAAKTKGKVREVAASNKDLDVLGLLTRSTSFVGRNSRQA